MSVARTEGNISYCLINHHKGELCIGGAGVAAGYLYSPELTNQRFVNNPFEVGKLYRTGDVVKRVDNNYFFVRRLDDQVKVSGYRFVILSSFSFHLISNCFFG